MTTFLDTSISDYVRQILFIHLYGRYDLLGLLEEQLPVLQEGRAAIIAGSPDESPSLSLCYTYLFFDNEIKKATIMSLQCSVDVFIFDYA